MSEPLGGPTRPLRVAVVGSGPSGFYSAEALQKTDLNLRIDMFDRLPTPFGLVRGGVAPDHPKIKNVTRVYEKIAARDGFAFYGNVNVGEDISIEMMRRHYDAIVICCGAETDRRLNVPGEDLPGSHTATAFVGWYNGHPDYFDRTFDLGQEVAVVIGQGNVAADVARILCKTVDELRTTDIAQHALDALAESRIREVHVIGRRGPAQAKFTPPELRELGRLESCVATLDAPLDLSPTSLAEIEASRDHQKNLAILESIADNAPEAGKRELRLRFLESPLAIEGDGRVERIVLGRNRLEGEQGRQRAVATGEQTTLDCGLIFRSIGYRGIATPGVPFDDRWGGIPNAAGRVTDDGAVVPGLYVAGWIKRGPSGVVGTNKPDAVETVACLREDLATLAPCPVPDSSPIDRHLADRGVRVVTYDDWKRIDAVEVARGERVGKPREKGATFEELLGFLSE